MERESAGDQLENDMKWFDSLAESEKKQYGDNMISTLFNCQTETASHILIHSAYNKLTSENEYTIGGTYNKNDAEFWFFCNTSMCHGNNYLLKLFVLPRRAVRFSLQVPKNNVLTIKKTSDGKCSKLSGATMEYHYSTTKKDEVVFIKAYSFTKSSIMNIGDHPLLLPCAINIHSTYKINPKIVNRIKLKYTVQLNKALYRARNEGVFILESRSHKRYPIHLFVAAAHSPVLRAMILDKQTCLFIDMNDEDVELLIEFLYIGSVKNLSEENAPYILMLAEQFMLPGLMQLGKIALSTNINVDNAVHIANLAKKYNLKDLLLKVFQFIKMNPALLMSSTINNLIDIDLMKTLLQYVGNPHEFCE